MGEIDTKPIESVQVAISLFGERKDSSTTTKNDQVLKKEKDVEGLLKELSSVKVQLEAKDLAHRQALHKLDHYQKTQDELSTLLKNCDSVKIKYIDECEKSNLCIKELETIIKEMSDKVLEFEQVQKQLSLVTNEYVTSQGQILNMETQIDVLRCTKAECKMQVEALETNLREMKTEELLRNISELNETIFHLQMKAHELEEENTGIQLATKTVVEAEAQQECTENLSAIINDLEEQLMEKSILTDLLQLELEQAKQPYICSQKVASDAMQEPNQLKEEMEQQQRNHINATKEVDRLNTEVENMRAELEKIRKEFIESRERETGAQVEIALLISELHKGRSKLAAVEAAEVRAQSEKSALYRAVQELALEAEEIKKENRKLKEIVILANESKNLNLCGESNKNEEPTEMQQLKDNNEETESRIEVNVTISRKVYEDLIEKAEHVNQVVEPVHENKQELKNLEKELEAATLKIVELRTRAEQAISRAEAAEKAKVELEEQKRRWKEHKERRNAALAALRKESYSKEYITGLKHENAITNYQPLGKVLNMKF